MALFWWMESGICLAEPAISSCVIESYLTGKSSPLVGNGNAFVDTGLRFVVDPRLVVAIAGAESTFGNHVCAPFNAWNWFWGGSCAKSPFASWADGLGTVTKFLNRSYLNKGYTSISAIESKYCTAGCGNWVNLVTLFYEDELGGDTRNLGLSSIDTSGCGPPNPECAPATCSTFVPCASAGQCTSPVCASAAGGGGVCVEGTTSCSGLLDCVTSTDCPDAGICAVESCCGRPVCVPRSAFCLP
jgi:hypothetical protein